MSRRPKNISEVPMGYRQGIPVLEGEWDGPRQIRIYCQYCRAYHHHGGMDEPPGSVGSFGHRVAHCLVSDSPYKRTGYHIVVKEVVNPMTTERRES